MPDIVGARPENPILANFRPFIPANIKLREFTVLPVIIGTLLGIVFGASSLYLVLKVGVTVSASIPVAVLAITTFRVLSKFGLRDSTILENNIVQTAGSAGESIAFGLGVTMPAIMILGFDLEIVRVMLVAILGGLLGILMMIPTRRALIVHQHGYLKYPEGTACAEVLKAGASAESREAARSDERSTIAADEAVSGGKVIISGFGIGFLYYAALEMLKAMKEIPEKIFAKPFQGASISLENNPALLGVGYIIGPRIAGMMMGGGVLSYLVLIPAIKYFGSLVAGPVAPETGHTIAEMSVDQIQHGYILYIGAGAVAAGGIISLIRSLPLIWHGLKGGLADLREARAETATAARTDQDLSMKWVIGGIILLLVLIMLAPQLNLRFNLLGALLIVGIGFLFTTVSSRLTGEVGSSSCPTSGITVATLLLTCLDLPHRRLDGAAIFRHGAFDRRDCLHRVLERRHDLAGSQDGFPDRLDAEVSANRDSYRHTRVVHRDRADPDEAERIGHGLHSSGGQQRLHLRLRLSRQSGRLRKRFERPAEARAPRWRTGRRRRHRVFRFSQNLHR